MDKVTAVLRRGFSIKLGLAVILVALCDWLFWQQQYGVGNFGLFGPALLGALILVRPTTVKSLPGQLVTVATAIYCVAIVFNASLLSVGLFWTALTIAALLPFASRQKDGWQWFWRLVVHGFISPLRPLIDALKLKKLTKRTGPRKFGIRSAFGLLALPIIGGAVFLALFVRANPVLAELVAAVRLPALDFELVVRMIVWAIVGTMIWSVLRPWRAKLALIQPAQQQAPSFGLPSLASIQLSLWVFNGLFLMQNGMDLAFMTGLVPLPDTMTLAQYSHRGAYPLIATALLAGLFVLVMLRPSGVAASDKWARLLVIVWIAQNVVLVGSSMTRTWDYVEAYSLTQLRIAALAWMVLVGVGLMLICWRLMRAKSGGWLINANLWAVGAMLTVFCFIDMRSVAAQWNVVHALEVGGRGVELDLCYMDSLGAGALAPLMSLEQQPLPATFRQRVKSVRLGIQKTEQRQLGNGAWTWLLEQRLAVAQELEPKLPALDLGPGWRSCHGYVIPPNNGADSLRPELTPSVTP
jgi:Domain of unknown function (DUF4173)